LALDVVLASVLVVSLVARQQEAAVLVAVFQAVLLSGVPALADDSPVVGDYVAGNIPAPNTMDHNNLNDNTLSHFHFHRRSLNNLI
jgi:hypothetical protein